VFGAAAWAVGRGREGHTFQWRERLGGAAFGVVMLAGFTGVGVLVLYLLVTANGASWG
jgi:hypothetical protein